jgi:hypothetical protein
MLDGHMTSPFLSPPPPQVRCPILLTAEEKEFARRIALSFGQMVNGFDILREHGRSYVCDVNGWSFVKSSSAYYHDAAGEGGRNYEGWGRIPGGGGEMPRREE